MFTKRGDPSPNVRAKEINTIDEVPDSSWFTNRIYAHDLTVEQVVEGQIADLPPAPGRWTLIARSPRASPQGLPPKTARASSGSSASIQRATRRRRPPRLPSRRGSSGRWATTRSNRSSRASIRSRWISTRRPRFRRARASFARSAATRHLEAVLRLAARDADGSYQPWRAACFPARLSAHSSTTAPGTTIRTTQPMTRLRNRFLHRPVSGQRPLPLL